MMDHGMIIDDNCMLSLVHCPHIKDFHVPARTLNQ